MVTRISAVEQKNLEMSVLAMEKIGHLKSLDVDHLLLVVLLISINGPTHQLPNGKLGPLKESHVDFLLHLMEEDIATDCAKLRLKETTVSLKNAFKMAISNSLEMRNGFPKMINIWIRKQ